jgi:hypothetical protein
VKISKISPVAFGITSAVMLVAAVVAVGRSDAGEAADVGPKGGVPVRSNGNFTLEQARRLARYPLYSVGREFRGQELVAVDRVNARLRAGDEVREDRVAFTYGLCKSIDGQPCSPPLEVQVWNGCERNRSSYDASAIRPDQELTLRGVPAAFFEGWTRLELYTGTATVVIFSGYPDRQLLVSAAEDLKPVNRLASSGMTLPRPAAGIMSGDASVCS